MQNIKPSELELQRWIEAQNADAAIDKGEFIPGEKIIAWLKSWGSDSELPPP